MLRNTNNNRTNATGKNNLSKYFNPSTLIQPKKHNKNINVSNIHCRSMEELDFSHNVLSQASTKHEDKKSIHHHSSLFNQKQNCYVSNQPPKSKSLSKFIALFQNSNILNTKNDLNQNKNDKLASKRKNYNGFSYDLKISANSNLINQKLYKNKQKQAPNNNTHQQNPGNRSHRQLNNFNGTKSTLIVKKDNNRQPSQHQQKNQDLLLRKMKDIIQQQKKRQKKYIQKIQSQQKQFQTKILQFQQTIQEYQRQRQTFDQIKLNFSQKQNQLQGKNYQLENKCHQLQNKVNQLQNSLSKKNKQFQQKYKLYNQKIKQLSSLQSSNGASSSNINRQKQCKQQDLVIKSLKKVINQQLNKIIDLQKYKIQNQYLHSVINDKSQLNSNQRKQDNNDSEDNHENSFQDQFYHGSQTSQNNHQMSKQGEKMNFTSHPNNSYQQYNYFNHNHKDQNMSKKREQSISPQFSLYQSQNQKKKFYKNALNTKNNHNKSIHSREIAHQQQEEPQQCYFKQKSQKSLPRPLQNRHNNNIPQQLKNHFNSSKQAINMIKQNNSNPNRQNSSNSNYNKQNSSGRNRQNKNMNNNCDGEGLNMIKVRETESSFSRDAIQQVTEQNQQVQQGKEGVFDNGDALENLREEEDSILEEVDQYLSKWRTNS